MAEMCEANCMLRGSTEKSLLIVDELGRGTSTHEGFGLTWAIGEHIASEIGCFCLFATHFHEMTKMADEIKGVRNMHTTCSTDENKITMKFEVA